MMNDDSTQGTLPKPPRTWLTLLMGAVLLVSGAVMGSGMTVLVIQKTIQQHSEGPPPHFNKQILRKLSVDLELTAEQEKAIGAIFETNQEHFRAIRKDLRGKVESELLGVREQVEAVLTPEQAKKWNRRFKDMRNRSFPGFRDGRWEHPHRERSPQRTHPRREVGENAPQRHRKVSPSDDEGLTEELVEDATAPDAP
jgi:Spy/CpxP family protein refolding chaperone